MPRRVSLWLRARRSFETSRMQQCRSRCPFLLDGTCVEGNLKEPSVRREEEDGLLTRGSLNPLDLGEPPGSTGPSRLQNESEFDAPPDGESRTSAFLAEDRLLARRPGFLRPQCTGPPSRSLLSQRQMPKPPSSPSPTTLPATSTASTVPDRKPPNPFTDEREVPRGIVCARYGLGLCVNHGPAGGTKVHLSFRTSPIPAA